MANQLMYCGVFRNFICTFTFIAVTVCVAIFYPNVSTVLSILGGLCSVSICYTIPRKFN